MAFFQHSVTDKYLNSIDKLTIQAKFAQFKAHFHNPQIQQNIRNSKEEQYQEGFLRDLFVAILGYTLNPQTNFNLTTEYKNIKDSKKADGAIIIGDKVQAVIELKGTDTTDLGKIETQAFGYKNNQPDCVYIITSNFEKLRFYIDNAIEYLEFNLFTLTEKEFELLYLCLAYENMLKGIPKKIKSESISQEDTITKNLYKDYSLFKRELHQNLVQLNPEFNELELFKKSQKLLDRFLFLFFAEDRQLLPPNSVRLILNDWRELQERDAEIPLYERFKKYFGYLNTGFKGKRYDVFAYNGGLFKDDEILDVVKIDDELLFKHTFKLSEYDFASEVDVNILGHIFENSLNELDEIKAQLAGQEIDKTKTKRKKDGVFYTPKYITKYIVENTVGKLCNEQKEALQIVEADYTSASRLQKKTKQAHLEKLTTYRDWLLQLTICDPACGSGAFLNQALDFLIAEHRYVDELQAKLFGDSLVLSDVEKSILENNLFGVDLNEESVEIAKLSLWLRTAQPNRKLNNLNNNIKCGNSLIDDPAIAGDKTFNWQREFPTIFREKQKQAWHITTATHNSRYSQRMFDNHVVVGEAVWLDSDDELLITQTVRDIAKEEQLNIVEYNICGDHMHLLLVCEEAELPHIVKLIKGRTARSRNSNKGINPLVRLDGEKAVSVWTQKFGQAAITDHDYLANAITYVHNNRAKHQLPELKALDALKREFLCTTEHAFRTEYTGGFDVVIGNPPYVNANELKKNLTTNEYIFLKSNYRTAKGTVDLYIYFFEKGLTLINNTGILAYITPNRFLSASYGAALREFLISNFKIESIINYSDKKVFLDASTYPVITFIKNKVTYDYEVLTGYFNDSTKELISKTFPSSKLNILEENILGFLLNDKLEITEKIISKGESLSYVGKINATSTAKEADEYSVLINENDGFKLLNTGTIDSYTNTWGISFLTDKGMKYKKPYLPQISNIISNNRIKLYSSEKIIISKIGLKCEAFLDKKGEFASINTNCIHTFKNDYISEYVLCWLNSKLYNFLFECFFDGLRMSGGYLLYSAPNLINTYIYRASKSQQISFIEQADLMLSLNKELHEETQKFQRALQRKFELEELPTKLQNWYTLTFKEFVAELGKKKVKLSLAQEAEWEDYFLQEQTKALAIKNQIDTTDKEIDRMVYALYELTEDEIKIVEGV